MRTVVAITLSLFACTFVAAAQTPEKPDFKKLADAELDSQEILSVARMNQKDMVRAVSKALRSKSNDELIGALKIIHAMGKEDLTSDVAKLIDHEDTGVADAAQIVLVSLSGSKASKAVKKLWEKTTKKDKALLPFLADQIVEAPVNLDTLEWLDKNSSESAEDAFERILKKIDANKFDKDQKKRIEHLSESMEKNASALPVFLPNAHDSFIRFAGNLMLQKGDSVAFDLATLERKKDQGVGWKIGALLEGEKALTEIRVADVEGDGYTFTLEPELVTTQGKSQTSVKVSLTKNWIPLTLAWIPYKDQATSNFYADLDGNSLGNFRFSPPDNSKEDAPTMTITVVRGSIIISDGGMEATSKLK